MLRNCTFPNESVDYLKKKEFNTKNREKEINLKVESELESEIVKKYCTSGYDDKLLSGVWEGVWENALQ